MNKRELRAHLITATDIMSDGTYDEQSKKTWAALVKAKLQSEQDLLKARAALLPAECFAPETDLGFGRVACEITDMVSKNTVRIEYREGRKAGKSKTFKLRKLTADMDGNVKLSKLVPN